MKFLTACLTFAVFAATAPAQLDPTENIKKILETIDEELEEIDRLLLQTRQPRGAGVGEQMRKLVKETQSSQERVVKGIDDLIKELEQMPSSGGGGGSSGQEQKQQNGDPQDQEQSQRRETEQQDRDQRGEDSQRPRGQEQREGQEQNRPNQPGGENARQGSQVPDSGEARHMRAEDRARWGILPQYDLGRHSRAGLPEVPEKYRRLLEAYQKANQRTPRTPR